MKSNLGWGEPQKVAGRNVAKIVLFAGLVMQMMQVCWVDAYVFGLLDVDERCVLVACAWRGKGDRQAIVGCVRREREWLGPLAKGFF